MEEDFFSREKGGILFFNSGDFASALLVFHQLLQDYPSYHEAHFNVAITLEKMQQIEEARDEFIMAIQINNSIAEYHAHLSSIYHKLNQFLLAERAIQRAIQLNPDEPEYHFQYGCLWAEKNQLELSNQEFLKTIQLDSEFVSAYIALGKNCEKMERWDEAKQYFESIIALFPDNVYAHACLSRYYQHCKEWQQAFHEIQFAISSEPNNKEYLTLLASIHYGLLQIEEAMQIIRHINQLYPDYSPAYEVLGRCYAVKADYENAIATYQQAILFDEFNINAWLGLKTIYERTDDEVNRKKADEKVKSITAKEKTLS